MWRGIIGGVTIEEAMRSMSHQGKGNWYPIFDLLNKTRYSEGVIHDINHANNNPQKCMFTISPSQFTTHSNYMHLLREIGKSNVPVIVDAEPQKNLVIETLKELKHAAFFKTYQVTDQETLTELDQDIRSGDINSFKLIRGTFLEKDSRVPWVLYKDKETVDKTFDCAVRMVIHSARRRPDIRLLVATHNKESIRKAIFEANMNLKNDDSEAASKQVQFALASGMGDAAEQIIIKHGYMIHRYIQYGPYVRKHMVV